MSAVRKREDKESGQVSDAEIIGFPNGKSCDIQHLVTPGEELNSTGDPLFLDADWFNWQTGRLIDDRRMWL